MRINKYLASCGIASRRKCEEFITKGKIRVNDKIVSDLSTTISSTDKVEFNNQIIKPDNNPVYIILNKPKGFITTCNDEKGRKTVLDLIDKKTFSDKRLFPVGRLDCATTGLIILTNDGNFAKRLTHPSTKVKKVYHAILDKEITPEHLDKLEKGIELDGEITHPASARILPQNQQIGGRMRNINTIYGTRPVIELIITQGRNRQVRRMFEALGYKVIDLKRTAIGTLYLGKLRPGEYKIQSKPPL
ncbi:MAG: rRNA pseudouridine synthase [Firmicutes bacterium]|nr:rRNA pseudouridine synthase [Bacillota bacterium]